MHIHPTVRHILQPTNFAIKPILPARQTHVPDGAFGEKRLRAHDITIGARISLMLVNAKGTYTWTISASLEAYEYILLNKTTQISVLHVFRRSS